MPPTCKNKSNRLVTELFSPTPVRMRPAYTHGLFGAQFVHGHMMADDRWTPGSLTEQFSRMSELLKRQSTLKKLDCEAKFKLHATEQRRLKRECHDGRLKMNMLKRGVSSSQFQLLFKNHIHMRRMFQNMPTHQVVNVIEQHTFAMHKEYDRLQYRLEKLQKEYKSKLVKLS